MKLEEGRASHGVVDESLVPEKGGKYGAESFGDRRRESTFGQFFGFDFQRFAVERRNAGGEISIRGGEIFWRFAVLGKK